MSGQAHVAGEAQAAVALGGKSRRGSGWPTSFPCRRRGGSLTAGCEPRRPRPQLAEAERLALVDDEAVGRVALARPSTSQRSAAAAISIARAIAAGLAQRPSKARTEVDPAVIRGAVARQAQRATAEILEPALRFASGLA